MLRLMLIVALLPALSSSTLRADEKNAATFLRQGTDLLMRGKPAQAIAAFDRAVNLDPRSATAHRGRGQARLESSDWVGAIADLTRALALEPGHARTHSLRARAFVEKGSSWCSRADVDRAIADSNRALELDATLTEARACLGLAHALRCENRIGLDHCDRAVRDDPRSAVARLYLGLVHMDQDDAPAAIADFTEAAVLAPHSFLVYRERAFAYRYLDDREKALADAEKAVALAPDLASPYTIRARVRLDHREQKQAHDDALKAIKLAPSYPDAHYVLSEVHMAAREYDRALKAIDRAIALTPEGGSALADRANCRLAMGQTDLALEDCRASRRLDPTDYWARVLEIDALTAKLESGRALAACDELLLLYPARADLYQTRSNLRNTRGDKAGAAADLHTALRLNPRLTHALLSRAYGHLEAKRYEAALVDIDHSLKLDPDLGYAHSYRSVCLEYLKRRKEAEEAFVVALRLDGADAHLDLANCRLTVGDVAGSIKDLDEAVRLRPDCMKTRLARAEQLIYSPKHMERGRADLEQFLKHDPNNSYAYFLRADLHLSAERLDDALADLDQALKIDPSYVQALVVRAGLRIDKGKLAEAMDDCDTALSLDPESPEALLTRGIAYAALEEERLAADRPAGRTEIREVNAAGLRDSSPLLAMRTETGYRVLGSGETEAKGIAPCQVGSPDGRLLLIADEKGDSIFVLDSRLQLINRRLNGHKGGTQALAFFPDGRRAISAGKDRCLRLWDVETGKELRCIKGLEDEVRCLACSPDGKRFASGHARKDGKGPILLWDAASGEELSRVEGHDGATEVLSFIRDGRHLVSAGKDFLLRLWQVETGKQLWSASPMRGGSDESPRSEPSKDPMANELRAEARKQRCLAVSTDGRFALSASEAWVSLWDLSGRKILHEWGVDKGTRVVRFCPGDRRIAVVKEDGSVKIWSLPPTFEQAVADLTSAARLMPKYDKPPLFRGMCYLINERLGLALKDFNRAIELNPKSSEAHFHRALLRLRSGETDRALADLDRVIELDPKDGEAYLRRGLIYLRKEEYRRAKHDLDRAIEIDPELKKQLPGAK